MEGKRLLRSLKLANFLSYGPEGTEIELEPLNVLIGPNGSGKSNLIEAINLLKALPSDVSVPFRTGGGIPEWLWKGEAGGGDESAPMSIEATVSCSDRRDDMPLRYSVDLASSRQQVELVDETIANAEKLECDSGEAFCFYSASGYAEPMFNVLESVEDEHGSYCDRTMQYVSEEDDFTFRQSVLSQRKDPERLPEITYLGRVFSQIFIFRGMNIGHGSHVRGSQDAGQPSSFLSADGSNLGIVLNDLLNQPQTKKRLLTELKRFYAPVEDITTKIHANTVETFFHERHLSRSTPSSRLSDGTLRYLCLLTILCHPTPPPLVCIEDPELGLHPDILPIVARLLKEASERTQLIVTTHSHDLVSALSDVPEAVIVCECDDGGSYLERLQPEKLKDWLDKYSLGKLWRMGELGGNP